VGEEARRINGGGWKAMKLTPKISSSQIWVAALSIRAEAL
jgi:hypothetical protein